MKDLFNILKLGLILLIITSLAAFSLSFTNIITRDQRDANRANEALIGMREILDKADAFEKVSEDILAQIVEKYTGAEAFVGKSGGQVVGYVVKAMVSGYGGQMEVFTAITTDNKVYGVLIGDNSETPGLGTKIEAKSFRDQFKGFETKEKVNSVKGTPNRDNNEVQVISGATVSTGAAINGVNIAREIYLQFLAEDKIVIVDEIDPLKVAQEILPETNEIIELEEDFINIVKESHGAVAGVYVAAKDGETLGYVIKTLPSGYNGPVEIFTVIDNQGIIAGMMVGKNEETGGLGTLIEEEDFTSKFKGIDASEEVAVDVISGATVSSEAAVRGVNIARQAYLDFIAEGKLTVNLYGDVIKDLAEDFTMIDNSKLESIKNQYPTVNEILVAKSGQNVTGYVIKTLVTGYKPNMEVITVIKADGTIYNVALGFNHETSGLGTEVGKEDFTSKFKGQKAEGKITSVDAISGATMSAEGFIHGVNIAIEVFNSSLK
jgi:Na+-translocating ferredoxin:NAD+ oxidoreductase subunit G